MGGRALARIGRGCCWGNGEIKEEAGISQNTNHYLQGVSAIRVGCFLHL